MLQLESCLSEITKDLSIIELEEELKLRIFGNDNYYHDSNFKAEGEENEEDYDFENTKESHKITEQGNHHNYYEDYQEEM